MLITGILTPRSIATAVAEQAIQNGARVLATSFGRAKSTTARTLRSLGGDIELLDYDAADPDGAQALAAELALRTPVLHGLLHAIAYAPPDALGDNLGNASNASIATTLQISASSLAFLVAALEPALAAARASGGASVVGLTFAPNRVWPGYGWMGVAKGALESITQSLAVQHGPSLIRVNLVDAGPLRTAAARSIPGSQLAFANWATRSPLGWDENNASAIAEACVVLLSGALSKTTGTTLIVDGGAHLVGN